MIQRYLLFLALLTLATSQAGSQSIYTEFGKNRVQYHDDFENWWMYETENFITYWYGKARYVAQTVIQLAELDNDEIQNILEHRFNDKIEIIVYLDVTDLKQSNLGSEEIFASTSGQTKILGNKMFVYFDGNHQTLRERIRQGIAGVYLESMLYGSNLQEIVQNAVLLNLPDWYKEGLIAYLGEEWSPHVDSRMRDIFLSPKGKYRDFNRMARDYPALAGHSFWYFIGRSYGKSSISNLLYLTRINRNLQNAFLYVLGVEFDNVIEDWGYFFEQLYVEQPTTQNPADVGNILNVRNKRNLPLTSLALNPDGQSLVYATNNNGRVKLYLYDLNRDKSALLMKTGIRNVIQETDYNYPLVSWHPDGNILAVIFERKDVIYLSQYDLNAGVRITDPLTPEIDRVYSLDYWHADTLLLTASTDGFSDIYKYMPVTRQFERVTEDFFDDLDARVGVIAGRKGILFQSNRLSQNIEKRRLDTVLPVENFDIYFMYPEGDTWSLHNLTQTPYVNEKMPRFAGAQNVTFLTNETGIWNRKAIYNPLTLQAGDVFLTNYDRNVLGHTSTTSTSLIYEHVLIGNRHLLLANQPKPVDPDAIIEFEPVTEHDIEVPTAKEAENMDARDEVDPRYLFQSEFKQPPREEPAEVQEEETAEEAEIPQPEEEMPSVDFLASDEEREPVTYNPSRVIPYYPARAVAHRLKFKLDYVNTTMDNSLLFSTLDTYAGTKREYDNPPLGILLKANIKDLFEDYVVEGGMRFPTSFNGSEYFLFVDDKKKRIDKRYAVYRKTTIENGDAGIFGPDKNQFVIVIGQMRLSYPLDVYTSVRATGTIRNDRLIELATDATNIDIPIRDDQRFGLKLEYVYDNTVEIDINFRHGSRYKAWVEVVKKFDLNLWEKGEALTFNKGFMTVLGVDARHYQRLDKHSIFAARFMASTSFGSERNLYYLGGVENWLFSTFDNTIPVPPDKNFAYQTVAANMRGFKFNARNGSSVALINAELRIPFLRYLSKRKIKSSFLRNLQAVGFVDVGTAWHGSDPFSDENPLNTLTLTNPPTVSVDVKYFRNPIVAGYGVGMRTLLFGYFIKVDYGWGWETGHVNEPIIHFSMGTDF